MKREDVVELRSKQCQRKWHEKAGEQQQPAKHLQREEERGKVRCAYGDKELYRQWIRRRRLVDKVRNPFRPKTVNISPSR